MGMPKACIEYEGEKLYKRTARILEPYVDKVYISGRLDQQDLVEKSPYTFVPDIYKNIGPIAGILSVFEQIGTNQSYIMVATDLPFPG